MIVSARQQETVDQLVWRTNGGGPATVELVLAANPGLAGEGPLLAEGRQVTIPEAATANPEPLRLVNLWD